jgi:hypothetical protein
MKRLQIRKTVYTYVDVEDDFNLGPDPKDPQLPEELTQTQLYDLTNHECYDDEPMLEIWAIDALEEGNDQPTKSLWERNP